MTWVEAERQSFAFDFRAADPNAPTLCAGWSARHLCAHLVQREHSMLHNIWDQATTKTPGEERSDVQESGVRIPVSVSLPT